MIIAILGIIASIAMISLSGRTDHARENVHKTNLAIIQGAVDVYFVDHNEYPHELGDLYLYHNGQGPYLRTPLDESDLDMIEYNPANGMVTLKKGNGEENSET